MSFPVSDIVSGGGSYGLDSGPFGDPAGMWALAGVVRVMADQIATTGEGASQAVHDVDAEGDFIVRFRASSVSLHGEADGVAQKLRAVAAILEGEAPQVARKNREWHERQEAERRKAHH